MGYEDDNNRGGREESIPSYKTPGVYPSGSTDSLGLSNTDLLQGSLGNWNNIVRDSDSDGNPRAFISFASNADITIPTISGENVPGRPIFVSITEELIFNHGVTMVGIRGVERDDWYVAGDSGFSNRQRYNRVKGVINEITTTFKPEDFNLSNNPNNNMAKYPFEILVDEYIVATFEDLAQLDSSEIQSSGGSSVGFQLSDIDKIHMHERINRWMYVVTHYWNVTIEDVKSYLSFIEENFASSTSGNSIDYMGKWNEIFGGKFKSGLFENPIGLDSTLFYISQNEGAVDKLAEDEVIGPFPTNYKIDFDFDDVSLWERDVDVDRITGQFPIRFLEREDAFFFTDDELKLDGDWEDLYDEYYNGSTSKNAFANGHNYGESTELLIFPRSLSISIPSEVLNPNRSEFRFNIGSFPVQSEDNPISNFVGNFADLTGGNVIPLSEGNQIKFGFPYFSYDYIFSNTPVDGDDTTLFPTDSSLDIVDFEVDCYTSIDDVDTTLKYYEIGTEEYRKTSFPIEVNLNLKLVDSSVVNYSDPIGSGFNLYSTFSLIDMLYANQAFVQGVLSDDVFRGPHHFRYDVIQWGDEDVLLTDEQIEASYYFSMYDIESYPPDTDSYEYKKFVQSHIKSKPANSISKHVYNSPGVKRLRIIAYKMSLNGIFVLQTYLIQKNIVVSDGNLSAQDFAVFGLGNYKYLPIKENQAIIGGLTADSDYNESISTILKDNNFIEEDYLERVSSVRYLQKFNQGLLGESSADTISSDIGQVRMFNTPKDIYSFIGGDRLDIINNGLSTLPINSSATDILIDNDNCIVDFNPPNNELFSIQNQAGKDEIGVIVGDYKVVQPKTSRIRREGDMNRPEIVTEKDRQAF